MMRTSEVGLNLIKQFEGFSSTIYKCPAGIDTIGYGHVVKQHEYKLFEKGVDKPTAKSLLKQDVQVAELAVSRLISVPLNQNQFDALVSFTFNLGSGALQRSTLRRKLNQYQYQNVPSELSRWIWVKTRKSQGLINRRNREAAIFQLPGQGESFLIAPSNQ